LRKTLSILAIRKITGIPSGPQNKFGTKNGPSKFILMTLFLGMRPIGGKDCPYNNRIVYRVVLCPSPCVEHRVDLYMTFFTSGAIHIQPIGGL